MYSEKIKLHEREKNHRSGDLRTIALDVTGKCNMRCGFCYAETFANKEPVALDVLKKVAKEAYEMGVFHYILQGGEVLADYGRLKAIIGMIYPEETYINIVSNGWMMTRNIIDELKDMHVDRITFSLDSGIEEEHDENRMRGGYRRVLEAIDQVLDAGLLSGISTVVTHHSLYTEGFKRAYEIAKDRGIKFDVQIAEPVGKWDGNRECLITEEDSKYILDMYRTSPILPNGQRMVKRDLFSGDEAPCCPAGTEFMAITVDGNFMPCNFIQATLGNIRDRSLREMREDLLRSDWFNEEYPYCILGESKKFFDEIVFPNRNKEKPLDAYKVFGLTRK